MRKIVINASRKEKRIGIIEDEVVVECEYYRDEEEGKVGSIYYGRVAKVLKGMNAAFVDIGVEKMAYLHFQDTLKRESDISSSLHEGQWVRVQILKEAVEDKGPKITERIEIANEYGVYKPYEDIVTMSKKIENEEQRRALKKLGKEMVLKGEGMIFRTVCGDLSISAVQMQMEQLRMKYEDIKKFSSSKPKLIMGGANYLEIFFKEVPIHTIDEIVVDEFATYQQVKKLTDCAHYVRNEDVFYVTGMNKGIEEGLRRLVWLKNGGYLLIDQTETMTVIDVNTGKFVGKGNQRETIIQTNELAAREVARQLRLRDIGGMILIDFINMVTNEEKEYIRNVFIEEAKKDRSYVRAFQFTMLGILEVTRKRRKKDLQSYLSQSCSVCNGKGTVLSTETLVYELEREIFLQKGSEHEAVLVVCSEDIKERFHQLFSVNEVESDSGITLFFEVEYSSLPFYRIARMGTMEQCKRN